MFPAKYSFNVDSTVLTAANCTNDYVVYALDVAGSGTQPNLVRFNNIYSGTSGFCGANPTVMSAYNINTLNAGGTQLLNGRLLTSPTMSLLGDELALIETVIDTTRTCPGLSSNGTCSIFHVLTWGTTGNNGSFSTATNTYTAVKPGEGGINNSVLTNLVYSSSTNTYSSPYVDYTADKAYFGDDNGMLYRTTCVFHCAVGVTPQIDSGWPVTVAPATVKMSPPVLDQTTNKVFVGASNGRLYMVDLSICPGVSCTLSSVLVGSANTFGGILDGPIVDTTFGTVFAFAGDNGSGSGVMFQTNTLLNLAPNLTFTMGTTAPFDIFDGAFDDAYYQNAIGSTTVTGNILTCGPLGGSKQPDLYWLPFVAKTAGVPLSNLNPPIMNTAASSRTNVPGNPGIGCTPLTEFKNGTTDRLFFSQSSLPSNKCPAGSGNASDGCVMMYDVTNPATTIGNNPNAALVQASGTSGIIIDNASTSAQASSIYFTNQATTKCTIAASTPAYCAIKVTQSALQ
jgi:hypothetical protein